jgi:plasmid replication initiation protein
VTTNIRVKRSQKNTMFSWIDGWEDLIDSQTKESRGLTLTVSDWFYRGVMEDGGLLSIDPAYFSITGGRERWLYRVARKHAGGDGEDGFAISMPTLFEKSGAEGTYRRFKFEMLRVVERTVCPRGKRRRAAGSYGKARVCRGGGTAGVSAADQAGLAFFAKASSQNHARTRSAAA